jgi:L-asparaginase
MARVALIFTGGTIATRPDAHAGGNVPVLDGTAILGLAPEVSSIADIVVVDWGMVPASHLRFGQMLSVARTVDSLLARPDVDGAVIVQGTDAIEETSFAYDLLLATDKPVVITGAMRDSSSSEYDGSRNLADSVRWAARPESRGTGAVVILDGTVIAADVVVKRDSVAMDTFQPRTGLPLARVHDGSIVPVSTRGPRRVLPGIPEEAVEDAYLVTATAGIDGALVRGLAPRRPRGLVIAATGSGNTHPDLLEAASDVAADGTTLVLTTRCATGLVSPVYAFPGGGAMWQRAGAIMSAFDGPKSRVALALGLACGLDHDALVELIGQKDLA